jgi:hypothetical protein
LGDAGSDQKHEEGVLWRGQNVGAGVGVVGRMNDSNVESFEVPRSQPTHPARRCARQQASQPFIDNVADDQEHGATFGLRRALHETRTPFGLLQDGI